MVQPTMASSCCKVSPGGHPWEAIKHSFCIIFFVCWEETRFWKPKTPLLSWLCYNPIDLSLHGPQIRKIFRYLNLWVVPENLKYKNKKWFYVIHLFNPTNFRNCRDQRHGGMRKSRLSSWPRTRTCWMVCSRVSSVSPTLSFKIHLNRLFFFAYISESLTSCDNWVVDVRDPRVIILRALPSSWRHTSTSCFLEKLSSLDPVLVRLLFFFASW